MCKVGKQYKLEATAFCIWILQCALLARHMIPTPQPVHLSCRCFVCRCGIVRESPVGIGCQLFYGHGHFICVGVRNCQKIHFSATKIIYLNQYRTVIN